MANVYSHTPVLSKIKLGENTYYVKDADVRAIIDTYGNVVTENKALSVVSTDQGLVTAAQVVSYVTDNVAGLAGAMHFKGAVASKPTDLSSYEHGDVIVVNGDSDPDKGKEFVVLVSGPEGSQTKSLVEIGDEQGHVNVDRTIAGIDLKDDITVAELQAALEIAAMAKCNTASAILTDYATGVNEVKFTPAVAAEGIATTATALSFTQDAIKGITLADVAEGQTADYTISGTFTQPTIGVVTGTDVLTSVKTEGSFPTLDNSNTKSFATAGLVGSMGTRAIDATGDDPDVETLVLTAAGTDSALVSAAYTANTGAFPEYNTGALQATGGAYAPKGIKITTSDASIAANYDKVTGVTMAEVAVTPTLVKGSKTVTVSPDAIVAP